MTLKSLLILSSIGLGAAFFQMFKSANPAVHTADTNAVRGVPEYLHSKYLEDTFVCDSGKTRISKSSVNDNYCDCADKSDEPGTSACGTFNSFHCINKGFKMILLPASRVDDHICDCCDGSDEAYGLCANTCDAAAEKERAALAGITAAYKIGSAARATLIANVIKEKNELADKLPAIAAEIDRTNGLISSVKASVDWAKIKANEAKESAVAAASQMVDSLLKVSSLSNEEFAHLLSKMVTVTGISQDDVAILCDAFDGSSSSTPVVEEHNHHHHHDDDHHDDIDEYGQDSYGDDGEHHHHHHDHDHNHEDHHHAEATVVDSNTPKCDFVLLSGDDRLLPICRGEDTRAAAVKLLKGLLKDQNNHNPYMLLTGFFKIHQTYAGVEEFVVAHIEATRGGACPAVFEGIREHCSLAFHLTESFNAYNIANDIKEESEDLTRLRGELAGLEELLREHQVERSASEQAGRDLIEHKDELELLALKDQCFDVSDGKFTYSMCVMDRITQKENEGHNTVTLGEYGSRENNSKDSSITLHFKNGQHCHAHGARKADVKVICGPENALKSASEPSTCFYNLLFESPIACTTEFAMLNGIVV